MIKYIIPFILLPFIWIVSLQWQTHLTLIDQWQLLLHGQVDTLESVLFYYTQLPRSIIALMIGASLGLAGSLLQQLTQNRLVSPMTLGVSSGAWLALVSASIWLPFLLDEYRVWFAMVGAIICASMVLIVAGRQGLSGLPIILSGIAINLLFGAIASIMVLLNNQETTNLFIWGAGDLTITSWSPVQWLWPKLVIGLLILFTAHKPLMLLKLGETNAQSIGLTLWPVFLCFFLLALWLVASAIASVGVIAFVGLLAPNIVRGFGIRFAFDELFFSTFIGALLLLLTDNLAIFSSLKWSQNIITTGTTMAIIGAPCLILFAKMNPKKTGSQLMLSTSKNYQLTTKNTILLILILLALILVSLTFNPSITGWQLRWPSNALFTLRWPRILTAFFSGIGMAIAGVVLQRLIKNPLASPDILGLSAGATLALVIMSILIGQNIHTLGPMVAFIGSLIVLTILLLIGRHRHYAPEHLILVGIGISAFMDGVIQFVLAKGSDDIYTIIGWISGSTYQVTPQQTIILIAGIVLLSFISLSLSKWLQLISISDQMATARGLPIKQARIILLIVVAMICALITSIMGPIAFVGLIAPHSAILLGARKVYQQIIISACLGGMLMILSDWIGRAFLYPKQLPSGAIASLIGGTYFVILLMTLRKKTAT